MPESLQDQPKADCAHGPLDGILVVSLEQAIAAPFATRQLADLGARVIKIERPGSGDFARAYDKRVHGLASHFVWCNRSKESVCLDLKNPKDLDALKRLIQHADVLVQNLVPGALSRLGLDPQDLRKQFPRLIVCSISGYGSDGPDKDRKAYDLLVQSEAGLLSVTGEGEMLAKVGVSIADIAAGMYAYSNVLAALIDRHASGKGSFIDVSMLEALGEWMGFPLYYAFEDQPPPPRVGAAHATIYPYGLFMAGDGKKVMLGLQNEREWKTFCTSVLEHGDLGNDPRFNSNVARVQNRVVLKDVIEGAFAQLSAAQVTKKLDAAGIANANVNEMADLWHHEQLKARQRWREVGTPRGPIPALLPPGLPDSVVPRMEPVPDIGEHTDSVLAEFGIAQ
jgi:itaconate CoA-transferase